MIFSVVAHGSVGLLDEFIELGVPLIVLVALYFWSNRKPTKPKDTEEGKPK